MTITINRRSLLMTAGLGLGAFAVPGFAQVASIAAARGFTHGVASGEPGPTSMLLWTRFIGAADAPATVRVEVAETPDFARVVAGGQATTGPWRDGTVKITATGLKAGTRYHYRFVAPDGSMSPVGRTRTLPDGPARRFGIATFSCANLPFGHFNAYGHAAMRDDIDLAVHLGDYYYEYPAGDYPANDRAIPGRRALPAGEIFALADYRLRHASYRADPDLMALHMAKPMVVQWDDHESANDSWEGGAQNHGPDEGDWAARKAAAVQAYREWMPISDEPWAAYDIGALGTLFRTETRLIARTRQPDLATVFRDNEPTAALTRFRDGDWQDPAKTMMGSTQEAWLADAMRRSVRDGRRWQVVGFGTVMGDVRAPQDISGWLPATAPAAARERMNRAVAASRAGLPMFLDSWGGYPAARTRFLRSGREAGADVVLLAGDSHNAWAFEHQLDGRPAAVEFGGSSVTSPGFEGSFAASPSTMAAALVASSPGLTWCDMSRRGYMATTLMPDRVTNDWVFVDTIRERSPRASVGHSVTSRRGRRVMT